MFIINVFRFSVFFVLYRVYFSFFNRVIRIQNPHSQQDPEPRKKITWHSYLLKKKVLSELTKSHSFFDKIWEQLDKILKGHFPLKLSFNYFECMFLKKLKISVLFTLNIYVKENFAAKAYTKPIYQREYIPYNSWDTVSLREATIFFFFKAVPFRP